MRISIVTINFNGSEDTIKLLRSLEEQADQDFETIVVDNASEEADFANLQSGIDQLIHSFPLTTSQVGNPQVKVIRNNQNLGFSGGNNVGIRQALEKGADWVILLNNDTWVERDFIALLKTNLEGLKGIVGMPIEDKGGIAYCGKIRWLKRPGGIHVYNIDKANSIKNKFVVGAAMAIHKNVFDKIGFLDENYFLYYEDVDFSIRAKRAGFKITTLQFVAVHHEQFGSSKKLGRPLILRYHYRNALYFNLKNGPWYIKLLVWPWSWFVAIKQVGKLTIRRNVEQSKAILTGVVDFYKNKMGKI